MGENFSGLPVTRWVGERDMELAEDFSYEDPQGRVWLVPKGSFLTGTFIPRPLWHFVGSPYLGVSRRAAIIYDYFNGESIDPPLNNSEKRKVNKMFYDACRFDGCTRARAGIMYISICMGIWVSRLPEGFKSTAVTHQFAPKITPEEVMIKAKFEEIYEELKHELDYLEFEELERKVHDRLDLL